MEGKALDVGNVGQILQGLATAALRSIVDSGQLDIAAACATSQEPLEFIAGMRIADGRALEESIAKLLAPEQNLPKELGVAAPTLGKWGMQIFTRSRSHHPVANLIRCLLQQFLALN